MKDVRITIVIEGHYKEEVSEKDLEILKAGFASLLTGASAEGYSKVVRVEAEEI